MTTQMILDTLQEYSNPRCKLGRLVREGDYIPIVQGLYETDPKISPYSIVNILCPPSYISFDRALCEYGIIPEYTPNFSCATINRKKTKCFETPYGYFHYTDVPERVFNMGIRQASDNGVHYWIATPEKAVCDKLYKLPPADDVEDLEQLMFGFMRFYEDSIQELNLEDICGLSEAYRCKNVRLLKEYLVRL